jgi:hypothetical protein
MLLDNLAQQQAEHDRRHERTTTFNAKRRACESDASPAIVVAKRNRYSQTTAIIAPV